MQPTPAPVATTQRTTIVAQSPAGHQLLEALHAIQVEFQANAACAVLPTGAVVLEPATDLEPAQHYHSNGYHVLRRLDANWDCGIRVQREIGLQKDGSAPSPYWYGTEARLDAQGRVWERRLSRLVIDDFGALVEVPE